MKYDREILRLMSLQSETAELYHEAAAAMGIADSSMLVLYTLTLSDSPLTQTDIVRMSGCTKQTIHSAVNRLKEQGLLSFDGGRRLTLTEAGKTRARETAGRIIAAENELLSAWSEEDRTEYGRLTCRYLTDLKRITAPILNREETK